MSLFYVVAVVMIIVAFILALKAKDTSQNNTFKIKELSEKIVKLQNIVNKLDTKKAPGLIEKEVVLVEKAPPKKEIPKKMSPQSSSLARDNFGLKETSSNLPPKEKAPTAFDEFIKSAKERFKENWTGILGSVAVVCGVSFLGIYGALMVAPIYKFLIITLFATVLLAGGHKLKSLEKWGYLGVGGKRWCCDIPLWLCRLCWNPRVTVDF